MPPPWTSSHAHTAENGPHSAQKIPAQNRKGQLAHVPNLHIPKRDCPSPPDDVPSLHRSQKSARDKHRKSSEVNENPTHKPEGIPTLISLHKHHSPIQPCWFIPQPASPAGIAHRPGFIPKPDLRAVEIPHTFGLTCASGSTSQSRCRAWPKKLKKGQ